MHMFHLRIVCGACNRRDCEKIPARVELKYMWCQDSSKKIAIVQEHEYTLVTKATKHREKYFSAFHAFQPESDVTVI